MNTGIPVFVCASALCEYEQNFIEIDTNSVDVNFTPFLRDMD